MSDDSTWALSPECKELWDAINAYVVACAGNPVRHVYGNTARMLAVGRVEDVVAALRAQIATLTAERDDRAATARQYEDVIGRIDAAMGVATSQPVAETIERVQRLVTRATAAEARVVELEAELAKWRSDLDTACAASAANHEVCDDIARDLRARAEKAEADFANACTVGRRADARADAAIVGEAAGYQRGQRDMLWRMAVGAAVDAVRHEADYHEEGAGTQYGEMAHDAMWQARGLSSFALRLLGSLGDEQAKALLSGQPHL